MPSFAGDKEWRVEDVPPNADNPLPGIWVRAWRGADPVESGPAWRFTPALEAEHRAAAAKVAAIRNQREAAARADAGD